MRRAGLVREQMLQLVFFSRGAIPHDIVAAMAGPQIVVCAGHWIAKTLLASRQAEGHVLEQFPMNGSRKRHLGTSARHAT